ncbi:MAG: FHA domain-containing protein [Clostridiales bacterium]|nr:FHA domain-containing protein [Clostridiales bacterium]
MDLSDLMSLERTISDLADSLSTIFTMLTILGIAFFLATYFVNGYALMCTGRKSKVDGDFMPFIPVARQIYQMKIARCPIWYIFFFGVTLLTEVSVGLILWLLFKLTGSFTICTVLLVVYALANMVVTFLYYHKFYSLFGFNPNTAWIHIIPAFYPIANVFVMLIAFSDSIHFGKYVAPTPVPSGAAPAPVPQNRGVIVGIAGMYKDATFDLTDGTELVFGRSTQDCNIVFDQSATDVSRKHCVVRFDGRANQYVVTDYSSNGTYLESGSRLESGQPKQLTKGTVIYLGSSRRNAFRLN